MAYFRRLFAYAGDRALAYIYITVQLSKVYFEKVNQTLNHNTARDIVMHSSTFSAGKTDEKGIAELFHNIMLINPSLEVYLLDTTGRILSYYAPKKKIVLDKVNLYPIRRFIASAGREIVRGDDPRQPGVQKVFSAAPVRSGQFLNGYMYVVLSSEQYDSVTSNLHSNYN